MIWIAIPIILLPALMIFFHITKREMSLGFAMAMGISIPLAILGVILTETLGQDESAYRGKFEIIAAVDNTMMEGNFYLFGGNIDEEPVYSFYRQRSDGAITQGWVEVNDSVIFEDQENKGFVEIWESNCTDWSWWSFGWCDSTYYEIHVPENSVTRQYEFDLN